MSAPLGADDYREGALARLEDARRLREQDRWVGAVYLAGRAVEAMCRSVLWTSGHRQGIGHDLRDLLKRSGFWNLRDEADSEFIIRTNELASIWFNNLRFIGVSRFKRHLRSYPWQPKIRGDASKFVAKRLVESCEMIIARLELRWQSLQRK